MNKYTIIINTTPLGMYPNVDSFPPIPYQYLTANHYLFDLVYNPLETLFLQKGKLANATCRNGFQMLEEQAKAAWDWWNAY
jgi:shikimate dehydrogenase